MVFANFRETLDVGYPHDRAAPRAAFSLGWAFDFRPRIRRP
jgi:hypothetical protein